jgi:dolichol-phosphate mannosyltransferase
VPPLTRPCVILPVYNEGATVGAVLDAVRAVFSGPVIVVDDGSSDATPKVLGARHDIAVITHETNTGYGRSLRDGFAMALARGYDAVVTMDCDGQHEPAHIPEFLSALELCDIVSGSRYLPDSPACGIAPPARQDVNRRVTAEIRAVTAWDITDAFCGFKAYRTEALERLRLTEDGYALPLELWAEAYHAGLRVTERPVDRIYFEGDRSFGQDLDDPEHRLGYYLRVWRDALAKEA